MQTAQLSFGTARFGGGGASDGGCELLPATIVPETWPVGGRKEWGKRLQRWADGNQKRAERANELLNPDFAQLERETSGDSGAAAWAGGTGQTDASAFPRGEKRPELHGLWGHGAVHGSTFWSSRKCGRRCRGSLTTFSWMSARRESGAGRDSTSNPREQNCLFMVGDVKQSIYRFRKADPTLFLADAEVFGGRNSEGAGKSCSSRTSEAASRCWMRRTACSGRRCAPRDGD